MIHDENVVTGIERLVRTLRKRFEPGLLGRSLDQDTALERADLVVKLAQKAEAEETINVEALG